MANDINARDISFLARLKHNGDAGVCIDRAEDRARQKCRRNGWAEFDRKAWLWRITSEGLTVLKSGVTNNEKASAE